jgi:hypothetical protein
MSETYDSYDEFLSASAFAKDELAVDSGFVVKARIPSVEPAFAIAAAQVLDVEDILSRGKGRLVGEARRWAFDRGDDSLMSLEWCAEALSSCSSWDISAHFLRTWLWQSMKDGFRPGRKALLRNALNSSGRGQLTIHEEKL